MPDVLPSEELVDEASDYGKLRPGTRLGRYELLVPIARGGMARVWAARLHGQRGFQKLVALKTILPHLAQEGEFERMFLDEARIASGVHHPNVCEIYELGDEDQTLYLAMEWVSGDSFARVLRPTGKTDAIEPRVVARVVADACAGLHAAHELTDEASGRPLAVVHRDLSPHNILLTADGVAKVADFGVAKALGQLHEATSAGQLKGKIAYMAPEQVTGAPVDRRSDVFSLGIVLYEATTGIRPFRGDGDHQVMHALLKGEVATPTSIMRGYPQELERIILRSLSPQPILRFPTAERMRFALEEFLARGQLVTQSQVAQVVRARIGDNIERRKERIRQASSAGDVGGWVEPVGGSMTPSHQGEGHRSGVKPANRPLSTTLQMDAGASAGQTGQTMLDGPMTAAPRTPQMAGPSASPPPQQAMRSPEVLAQTAAMASGEQAFVQHATPLVPPPFQRPGSASDRSHHGWTPSNAGMGAGIGPASPMGGPPLGGAPMAPPTSLPPSGSNPYGPAGVEQPWNAQEERPSQVPAGAGHYALAVGAGILVAALIATGGFFAWRARTAARDGGAIGATASPVPVPVPMPTTAATSTAGPGAPAQGVAADITFRLAPEGARLNVDGADLAPDVRSVPRPPIGRTVTVTVRAKGHEDATLLVDFFTASPAEVTLKRAGEVVADTKDTKPADVKPADVKPADPKPADTGNRPRPRPKPKDDPSLPANPY